MAPRTPFVHTRPAPRLIRLVSACVAIACLPAPALRAATEESAAPVVAVTSTILFNGPRSVGEAAKEAPVIAELVQLGLEAAPSAPRFVERTALDTLIREQSFTLAGRTDSSDPTAIVRVGRLLHADWILRLQLHADNPAGPCVAAEVVDVLRADLLARADAPLSKPPDENWLLRPGADDIETVRAVAARALESAMDRAATLSRRTILAPLVLIDRSGTERLAPLAPLFLAALRADHPSTHAISYDAPDEAFAESALFLAGLTDLDLQTWAHVADAYLWGEFSEDETYVGPVADVPVSLTVQLWREGDTPQVLEFVGTLGALDELARRSAAVVLDAAAGAKLAAPPAARRAAAARLVATADPLANESRTRHLTERETTRARLARETRHAQLLGLASFFDPADVALRERHLTRRLERTPHAQRVRWADEFWRHVDQHLLLPDGSPDLALLSRAIASPHLDYSRPGFAARTVRFGSILKNHPPAESVVRKLWSRFLGAARISPDEPGLLPALESLWPLIRRARPDLADFVVRADMNERATLAQIYRADPARLRALLTDRLFPLDFSPLSEPPLAPPPPSPSTQPAPVFTRPSADPANTFTAFQSEPFATLLELAQRGPLAAPPQLSAPIQTLPLWPLAGRDAAAGAFPPLPSQAHFSDLVTDGRDLWASLAPASDNTPAWQTRRLARVAVDSRTLTWPVGLAECDTPFSSFWRESAEEFWFATRGNGLRILRPGQAAPLVLDASHGLPDDTLFQLRRGHGAVFLAPSREKDNSPATLTVSAVDLRDHRVSLRSAATGPDLAALPASARAAILSFPVDAPRLVVLPEQATFALPPAELPPEPPHLARTPETLREKLSPRTGRLRAGGSGAPDDPARPGIALLTGPRDGYWVASPRSIVWASGLRRVPLAHWLQGRITALADDGRRLLVRLVFDPNLQPVLRDQTAPDPALDRLYAYDYVDGRWLGWLALPANGFLTAGGDRLLIALSPHLPLTVLDTSALAPVALSAPSAVTVAATPPPAPAIDRATREAAKANTRRRDAVFDILNYPPADPGRLAAEIAAGFDPFSTENDASPLIFLSLWKKDFPAVELFLRHAHPGAFDAVVNRRAIGLTLLHGLLEARRPELARKILDSGFRPVRHKSDDFTSLGWLAVRSGDVDLVARLHGFGFPLETSIDEHALREAVAQKNLPLLKFLLAHPHADGGRRDPDDSSGNGLTPLFAAADLGWTEGVRTLLAAGARNFHGDHATGRSLRDAAAPWPEIARLVQNAQAESAEQPAR